jgi:CxxC-x17-CxxC domain-containing protein
MENFQDEQIVCASCGLSFLFSAAEASVYAARQLASPPKRCKNCRKARKEQLASPHHPSAGHGERFRGGPQEARGRRYTGDVNEYRSPMQDNFPPPVPYRNDIAAPARGNSRGQVGHGEYRSPSFPDERSARRAHRGPSTRGATEPNRRPEPPRYPITCKACGAEAEVPFKPTEGRDLFCKPCYRSRRAS